MSAYRNFTSRNHFRGSAFVGCITLGLAACGGGGGSTAGNGQGGASAQKGGAGGATAGANSAQGGSAAGNASSSGGANGTSGGASGTSGGASGTSGGASNMGGGTNGSKGGAGGTSSGSGGTNGTMGGTSAMGGRAGGSGGTSPSGGAAGSGGGVMGPGLTDVSKFDKGTCTTTPTVTAATKIPSVGIATFKTDLAGAERAIVQFGKTATYTLEAPVNWAATDHRTLVLGMPSNTQVHYRVVVFAGNTACVGDDATFMTGAPVSGAPRDITPMKGTSTVEMAPGFVIGEGGGGAGGVGGAYAYIINKQGEVVWAYKFPVTITRALMSWDGMYMYGRELGPFDAATGGAIYRVGMDGEGEMKLPVTGGTHHDLVATPTGIAYPAKEKAGACDCLFTAGPDGSNSKCLVDLDIIFGKFKLGPGGAASEKCHVNAVRYYDDTKTFSISDREKDAIAFFSVDGKLLGSIGAQPTSTTPNHALAEGADSTTSALWRVQHGHDWYEPNKIVLFSNGVFQNGTSRILHYTINGDKATLDWQYVGMGNSPTFSDAQRLPNGNFFVTSSQTGNAHEIDPSQKLVQSYAAFSRGYSSHRPTLYGRPPGR